MNVNELNEQELNELLESLKDKLTTEGEEKEEVIKELTVKDVKVHYADTYFVKDDFFCNQ